MTIFPPRVFGLDTVRAIYGCIRTVASRIGGSGGSTSSTTDRTCDRVAGLDRIPPLTRGFVVRSGMGSYDCEVSIGGGNPIPCSVLAPILHDTYGVSQACMPVPGSTVLVYAPSVGLSGQRASYGIVLGVIPDSAPHGVTRGTRGVKKLADTEFAEGGVSQVTETGPAAIASDRDYLGKGEHQCGRPHDIVPGEYGLLSHSGAGVIIGALSTAIKGSEAASVRCSALDDQVRVVSGHFRHISSAGSEEVYNDGGFISVESAVSLYQAERLGVKGEGSPAFTWTPGRLKDLKEVRSGIDPMRPTQTAKKRLYRYAGYLGDVVNVFVSNPSPDEDVCEMSSSQVDQGLLHYHVDSSGRFSMRSAGGILLERFDRIPVPKRTHYAWDPSGEHASDTSAAEKKPFSTNDAEHNEMAIGLTIGDAAAWWNSSAYLRFKQFGKDFIVPDQNKLRCPYNRYDEIGKGDEEFDKYDARHSYIGLTPNGGIVLRDAWGSEIVMADGRITLNAAANIEVRSGSSVVILGGDDVVAKAYNSIDLSATNNDVRLKAENNLQIVSMSRGVLIQSKAQGNAAKWDKKGEDAISTGVVIKADKSSVAVVGEHAEIQGRSIVSLSSFKDDKPSGNIVLAGKVISGAAEDSVVVTAKGTSGIVVSEQSAVVCAPSAVLLGGKSAAEASGKYMLIGIPVDIGIENLYARVISSCDGIFKAYLGSVDWLSPFTPKAFSEIRFTYRTSKQYGTDPGNKYFSLTGGVFSVYEPSWAAMSVAQRAVMGGCAVRTWDEKADSDGEFPWPGKDAMPSGYKTYRESNVGKNGTETPSASTAAIDTCAFSGYHIRTIQ